MNKVEKVTQYIHDFLSTRYNDYRSWYENIANTRHVTSGINSYENGPLILNRVTIVIDGWIQEKLTTKPLVPQVYATDEMLLEALKSYKNQLADIHPLLDAVNPQRPNYDYYVGEFRRVIAELTVMLDRAIQIYDEEDTKLPYHEIRHALIAEDVAAFINQMKSVLASIPYNINKTTEGLLHASIHICLTLIGFEFLSEEATNLGRIDGVIRFSDKVYIMEFKQGTAKTAMKQIHEKKYYEKFLLSGKKLILVGVGFNKKTRNIKDYLVEVI